MRTVCFAPFCFFRVDVSLVPGVCAPRGVYATPPRAAGSPDRRRLRCLCALRLTAALPCGPGPRVPSDPPRFPPGLAPTSRPSAAACVRLSARAAPAYAGHRYGETDPPLFATLLNARAPRARRHATALCLAPFRGPWDYGPARGGAVCAAAACAPPGSFLEEEPRIHPT